jgi:hypothetical protein
MLMPRMHMRRLPSKLTAAACFVLTLALAVFYYAGATEHGRRINVERGRADQSGYLWDAVAVHGNWQGNPPVLIGERNRMPLYPGLLALLYDPALSPDEFFERGKRFNILLSFVLLAALWLIARRFLPALAAANFVLVVAFGYFIFRAGYVQCELLFYTLLFAAFVCFVRLLTGAEGRGALIVAAVGGVVAALAHLTKASMLPLAAIFVVVFTAATLFTLARSSDPGAWRRFGSGLATVLVFLVTFLATLYPYISNSKRVFGHYFYNVNTTFYIWYDDWPSASIGTYQHGDGVGWPKMRRSELPSMERYLREHTPSQIAARLLDGFRDMVVVNYQRYWIMKYLVIYLAFAVAVALLERQAVMRLVRRHLALLMFLLAYAVVYLLAIAFYKPISGTTSRMFLAHVAPLLFMISWFVTRPPFASASWAGVSARAVHPVVTAMILFDVAFMLWPRLFADFTGY